MISQETIMRLKRITVTGRPMSIEGLRDTAQQFEKVASDCDSAGHEIAALQIKWAARRLEELQAVIGEIETQCENAR